MEELALTSECKYCNQNLEICVDEGLACETCKNSVHVRCLKRGSVPGGLNGDLFYKFICEECSPTGSEKFTRIKLSWLQVINLVIYHLQTKCPGLARNGFFHWRNHVVTFIDRNWEILFTSDVKKKKKWVGTVAGRLSYYSSYLFLSGARTVFNKPAWWTLMYPKLTPSVISNLYSLMAMEKQKAKLKNEKKFMSDADFFQSILTKYITNEELIQPFNVSKDLLESKEEMNVEPSEKVRKKKRKRLLPRSSQAHSNKIMKANTALILPEETMANFIPLAADKEEAPSLSHGNNKNKTKEPVRLLDPLCHFNTSLNNISRIKGQKMHIKLLGGIRKELVLSPYSAIYLKPYIRRDFETFPPWLRLMAEVQLVSNKNNADFILPPRAPIDFTYVQPEHIPAINSLCNQFFWPGIDLTESLQYPDFSCVALYKKLIIGFAFLVPDVKHTENYISFVFTRPGWRNCGMGKFMVYHLIQTSLGRDITLHVSINNPALFLYQKFGFKVENVVLDFYDKYFRSDVSESKHAFFCRLER